MFYFVFVRYFHCIYSATGRLYGGLVAETAVYGCSVGIGYFYPAANISVVGRKGNALAFLEIDCAFLLLDGFGFAIICIGCGNCIIRVYVACRKCGIVEFRLDDILCLAGIYRIGFGCVKRIIFGAFYG